MGELKEGAWVRVLPSKRINYYHAGKVGFIAYLGCSTVDVHFPMEKYGLWGLLHTEVLVCHGDGTRTS